MSEAVAVTDTRYLYGANCTWFGPVQECTWQGYVPCCPGCGGVLYEADSRELWWNSVRRRDLAHPGCLAFMEWLDAELRTGRHFGSYISAASAYERETGRRTPGWEQPRG